jgi:hypothetical protein
MLHFSLMQFSPFEAVLRSPGFDKTIPELKLTVANQRVMSRAKIQRRLAQRLPFSRAKLRSKRGQEKKQGQEKEKDTGGDL